MKIQKLQVSKNKFDINLQFYFFLKLLVQIKPSDSKIALILENYYLFKDSDFEITKDKLLEIFYISKKDSKNSKSEKIEEMFIRLLNKNDLEIFIFSVKLYRIKDLLLQEAKIIENSELDRLENLDPLSLQYDEISVIKPYTARVNGALLGLLFFDKLDKQENNFISQDSQFFLENLANSAKALKKKGLEPNQIFMLMFTESVNQSIKSESGSNFEDRIHSVLSKNNITNITKKHDQKDKSTEFDFFFSIDGRTYGISAKRTLRERYKQFIKTARMTPIDVMIDITLGLDLNEEKAKTILNHGIYIFVADEIYKSRKFLQESNGVFSVKDLSLKTLKSLK